MPQGLSAVAMRGALRVGPDRHQRRADDHGHRDRRQRPNRHRRSLERRRRPTAREELGPRRASRRAAATSPSGAFGARAAPVPSLAMLLLFSRNNRAAAGAPQGRPAARCHATTARARATPRNAPRRRRSAHSSASSAMPMQQQRRRRPDLDRLLAADAHLARRADRDVAQLLEGVAAAATPGRSRAAPCRARRRRPARARRRAPRRSRPAVTARASMVARPVRR